MATPTEYQRVGNVAGTPSDYDATAGNLYLKFDGIDDALQTNSIDFTATDKMQVFAGVRKLSDGVYPVIVENYTSSTAPLFSLHASESTTLTGYAPALTTSSSAAWFGRAVNTTSPITNVVSASYFSKATTLTDAVSARINGSASALTNINIGIPSGTSNFVALPLYIGARAGTSLFFNGNLYNLIVRGAQSSAAQIESTEQWVNGKTAAF